MYYIQNIYKSYWNYIHNIHINTSITVASSLWTFVIVTFVFEQTYTQTDTTTTLGGVLLSTGGPARQQFFHLDIITHSHNGTCCNQEHIVQGIIAMQLRTKYHTR